MSNFKCDFTTAKQAAEIADALQRQEDNGHVLPRPVLRRLGRHLVACVGLYARQIERSARGNAPGQNAAESSRFAEFGPACMEELASNLESFAASLRALLPADRKPL
jgi:hypothetical protein